MANRMSGGTEEERRANVSQTSLGGISEPGPGEEIDNLEFHVFASIQDSWFELQIPGDQIRVQFGSLYNAARYARRCSNGRAATIVVHDLAAPRVNCIPFYGTS